MECSPQMEDIADEKLPSIYVQRDINIETGLKSISKGSNSIL